MIVATCLLSCRGRPSGLEGIRASAAYLEDVQLISVGVVGGGVWGDGRLVVVSPDLPYAQAYPVELNGGMVGVVLEFDVDGVARINRAELNLPAPTVPANDLLGRYWGGSFGVTAGVGVDYHTLKNRRDVSFDTTLFSAGLGVMLSGEWLRISLAEAEPDQGTPTDTAIDTAAWDSSAATSPGPRPSSGGCGCASPSSGSDTGRDSGASSLDDTGQGRGDTDGCGACASAGPAVPPWWLAIALAPWIRRRRWTGIAG